MDMTSPALTHPISEPVTVSRNQIVIDKFNFPFSIMLFLEWPTDELGFSCPVIKGVKLYAALKIHTHTHTHELSAPGTMCCCCCRYTLYIVSGIVGHKMTFFNFKEIFKVFLSRISSSSRASHVNCDYV